MAERLAVAMNHPECDRAVEAAVERLLTLGGEGWQLAARILGRSEGAEDVVQQAYLEAIAAIRAGGIPQEARPWFLRVVANKAKDHRKSEARRGRRAAAMMPRAQVPPTTDPELVGLLRGAMAALDEEYRVPLALCYEHDLTCRQAAAVLEIPETTLRRRLSGGLERLRTALAQAGCAAAPAALVGGLAHTAPPVPATLPAALEQLVASGVMVKSTGAAAASAAAKGGMAMKVIAGVVAAAALAGSVAVLGSGFKVQGSGLGAPSTTGNREPGTALASPPPGTPAPVNDYKGMQEREEVFEFTEKPKVTKDGTNWVITFASKGKCDATVAILGKEGRIVRHLASGVLGVNAPYPFQQGSLSQKLEWDGLKDDFSKADPAGCKVKVGLGLKAKFVRNLMYDPYDIGVPANRDDKSDPWLGDGEDGTVVVMQSFTHMGYCWSVRAFTKDGKYVRTLWPPPARDIEKVGVKLTTTVWGDKSPWSGWFGAFGVDNSLLNQKADGQGTMDVKVKRALEHLGVKNPRQAPRPANLPPAKGWITAFMSIGAPCPHLDQNEEWVYWSPRFNLKTGQAESEFKEWGGTGVAYPWGARIGPGNESGVQARVFAKDGLVYAAARTGGEIVMRLSRDGKFVPFKENVVEEVGGKLLGTGCAGNGRGHFDGLDVTEDGKIVVGMLGAVIDEPLTPDIIKKVIIPGESNRCADREKRAKEAGLKMLPPSQHIGVWDRDGKILTKDAVPGMGGGHGYAMDRDGNLYVNQGGLLPVGQKHLDGVAQPGDTPRQWGGSVIKFRGLGGKYPLGTIYGLSKKDPAPADAAPLAFAGGGGKEVKVTGMLWAYGGQSNLPADQRTCDCNFATMFLDDSARLWLPNNAVSGVMAVDANGNRIMRVGKYGNVDDVEADVKEGKDGLRFAYVRAAIASDNWLVCTDNGNQRLVQAALAYAAEETAPLP